MAERAGRAGLSGGALVFVPDLQRKGRAQLREGVEGDSDLQIQGEGYFQGVGFVVAGDQQHACRKGSAESKVGEGIVPAASGQRYGERESRHRRRISSVVRGLYSG